MKDIQGEDVFHNINLYGMIFLSEKAAIFIQGYGFTNGEVIHCEKYEYYFNISIQ
ncbi:MAG: hypothetical protein KJ770_00400 [Actinobacteria bacterium]|nr:hypothetical protein [Actinomycetota bacterium]MBU4449742.1 hypothetical protein [Actinomycetota bacterium]